MNNETPLRQHSSAELLSRLLGVELTIAVNFHVVAFCMRIVQWSPSPDGIVVVGALAFIAQIVAGFAFLIRLAKLDRPAATMVALLLTLGIPLVELKWRLLL